MGVFLDITKNGEGLCSRRVTMAIDGWSQFRGQSVRFLATSESLRLGCFAAVLAMMALWEALAPRRRPVAAKSSRWISNLALVSLNTLLITIVVRLLLPLGAVGMAVL